MVELAATATDVVAGQSVEDEAGLETLDQMHRRVVGADALVDCGSSAGSPVEGAQDALEGEVAVPTEVVDAAAPSAAAEEGDEDTDDTAGSCWDGHSEPSAAGEACTESVAAHWDP